MENLPDAVCCKKERPLRESFFTSLIFNFKTGRVLVGWIGFGMYFQ